MVFIHIIWSGLAAKFDRVHDRLWFAATVAGSVKLPCDCDIFTIGLIRLRSLLHGSLRCIPMFSRSRSATIHRLRVHARTAPSPPFLPASLSYSQHQILRAPGVRLGKVDAVFITHLHGDHLFGLPGLLCTMSATTSPDAAKVVTLVGPTGIADYIRSTLLVSYSILAYKLRVVELVTSAADLGRGVRACCSAHNGDSDVTAATGSGAEDDASQFCLEFMREKVVSVDGVWTIPGLVRSL